MSHADYVRRLRAARFVFSPRGHGGVNFRDFEALAMGAIPLVDPGTKVKTGARWHGRSYAELPVLPVLNWTAITPAYLEDVWERWNELQALAEAALFILSHLVSTGLNLPVMFQLKHQSETADINL